MHLPNDFGPDALGMNWGIFQSLKNCEIVSCKAVPRLDVGLGCSLGITLYLPMFKVYRVLIKFTILIA